MVWPDFLFQKTGTNAEIIKLQVDPEEIGSGGFGKCFRCFQSQMQGSSLSAIDKAICLKLVCEQNYLYAIKDSSSLMQYFLFLELSQALT